MNESISKSTLFNSFNYKNLTIDCKKYLIGIKYINDEWHILLTDLTEYYEEQLSKEQVIQRCEELNPFLVDFNFEDIIHEIFNNIPKYSVSCTINCINLEYQIEDGKFVFKIDLTKSTLEHLHLNFTENLYLVFSELLNRYNQLLEIVKRKDEEIEEYKAQGVELLRKSLVTDKFTEKIFESKLLNTNSVDRIDIFLKVLNFYQSIKDFKRNDNSVKQESLVIEAEAQTSEEQKYKTDLGKSDKAKKRHPSSDIRCAVPPKLIRKTKTIKQESKLQYL